MDIYNWTTANRKKNSVWPGLTTLRMSFICILSLMIKENTFGWIALFAQNLFEAGARWLSKIIKATQVWATRIQRSPFPLYEILLSNRIQLLPFFVLIFSYSNDFFHYQPRLFFLWFRAVPLNSDIALLTIIANTNARCRATFPPNHAKVSVFLTYRPTRIVVVIMMSLQL